jgi:plasmid stabilization system protein ParE
VIVLFKEAAAEAFSELPRETQRRAVRSIKLISTFPRMFPLRDRGLMRGYRYFVVGRFLFYYSVSAVELRIAAIIPAATRRAERCWRAATSLRVSVAALMGAQA